MKRYVCAQSKRSKLYTYDLRKFHSLAQFQFWFDDNEYKLTKTNPITFIYESDLWQYL